MSKAYPEEFRNDVVALARKRDPLDPDREGLRDFRSRCAQLGEARRRRRRAGSGAADLG